ncbi:alpha/beta hydrolase [uncultured Croceicoccus sp.]|uniref:alpha/beta hydrolase n=1 Tax=uncultured Croceicoccus sp. TaxID=1295329 RepID=UPI00261846CC|nr:alpha/beta hydrolase [uncultured Croceicoccus sp.]
MTQSQTITPGDDIDPEIRRFVRAVNAEYDRLTKGGETIAERRAIAEQVRQPWRSGGPQMAETIEIGAQDASAPLRIYRPLTGRPLPALIYLHGGGWTSFSLDTHDRLMREYAAHSGAAVIGVDYSLSPEVRFPVALDEIGAAVGWLETHGANYGIEMTDAIVGGDSAGANLALATAMRMRDAGRSPFGGLILNYGAFDERLRDSHSRYGGPEYMLTADEMDWFWRNYRGDDRAPHPLATPLNGNFADLPPAFFCVAQCDILADENRETASRMAQAGVDVALHVYEGATHSFLEAVSISALAREAIADAAGWMRSIWRPG